MACIQVSENSFEHPSFTLQNQYYTYQCCVFDNCSLLHLYFGSPLQSSLDPKQVLRPKPLEYAPRIPFNKKPNKYHQRVDEYSPATIPFEYPSWGTGDLRETPFECRFSDGSEAYALEFDSYTIHSDLLQPEGMPLIHREDDSQWSTLCIKLVDPYRSLQLLLYYCIHPHCPCLFRWVRVSNTGAEPLFIRNPSSASLDLAGAEKDLLYLFGAWGRERHVQRMPLYAGHHQISAANGASSHRNSPFIALLNQNTTEYTGEALGLALGYSGNFQASCSFDEYEQCRISIGIHKFHKTLAAHESADTPMAVLAHSSSGVNKLSHCYHETIRNFISPPRWRKNARKTIINSWEAMYYDISEEKILELARNGKDIGAELLVLDDGWFSNRRTDTTSLGDWWINKALFPQGIGKLADQVRSIGLDFGIWVEPEMLSKKSKLFDEHPEWAIQIHKRPMTEMRNQYVLDCSNPDVQNYILQQMTNVFTAVKPDYVKWDMNRNMTEPASPARSSTEQGSFMHDYILGVYRILAELQKRFPTILFEGCAGGGGRFDLGLAHYSPRFWTSDQSDAVERLPIQYGTSIIFPPEMIGSHVSAVPNHQVGRSTPASSRALTALAYSYGYELDPQKLSHDALEQFAHFSALYARIRSDLHTGQWYRLRGPLHTARNTAQESIHNLSLEYAWMVCAAKGKKLYVFYACPLIPGTLVPHRLALPPIDNTTWKWYTEDKTKEAYSASWLKTHGLPIPDRTNDYQVVFWELTGEQ